MASPSAASARGHASRLRTWDYCAGRCIKLKLGHFPSSQVACNKDKDRRLIHPKVVDELMRLRPMRRDVSLEFWGNIIKEHNLHGGVASDLPLPAEEEVVNKELNSSLAACHCSNPAAKSSAKLLRWLAYAPAPNRTELIGLLSGSAEGPSLSSHMSGGNLYGVLKDVARVKAHASFPDLWGHVSNHFDGLLVRQWQKSQSKGTTRSQFLRTWRNEISLFAAMQDATEINSATEDDSAAVFDGTKLDHLCSGSLIGSELFAPERCTMEV